jgi:hypothetical protein
MRRVHESKCKYYKFCHNLSLGQGLAKVQAKNEAHESHFHAPRSVGKCEGMNSHTPKWVPTLGVGVPMDS